VNGRIATRDARAIRELTRRGLAVTLCTGRMYSGTRSIAAELSVREPVACIDGSHIVDPQTNRELSSAPLAPGALSGLFRELSTVRPSTFVFAGDRLYHDAGGIRYLPYLTTWSEELIEVDSVLDDQSFIDEHKPAALVAIGKETQISILQTAVHELFPDLLQAVCFPIHRPDFAGYWGMVVRAAQVDKGTALDWLAAHYGITVDQIVAIGDWLNDVPMFRRAGRSFAMAQAPDAVKEAATDVLLADARKGGGIAEAAERAGLL
jgi:hydroxymethylpyrimidine pyrophosphatase-like HAD family hydrolase